MRETTFRSALRLVVSCTLPPEPRPPDRGREFEHAVEQVLGRELGTCRIRLVSERQSTDFPITMRWQGWAYDGHYTVDGSRIRIPVRAVAQEDPADFKYALRDSLPVTTRRLDRYGPLLRAYERDFPKAISADTQQYAWLIKGFGTGCSDQSHARIPRLVKNKFGTFDPSRLVIVRPPESFDSAIPPDDEKSWEREADKAEATRRRDTAVYYDTGAMWRLVARGARQSEVFEKIRVHEGCDLANDEAFPNPEVGPNMTVVVKR